MRSDAASSLEDLAWGAEADLEYLERVVDRQVDPYQTMSIPKPYGQGVRIVDVPNAALLAVHGWLLRKVITSAPTHRASYAYTVGRSVKECAAAHLGARWVVRLDLRHFFTSIDERWLYYEFLNALPISRLFAFQLARLSTRMPETGNGLPAKYALPVESYYRSLRGPAFVGRRLGYLPQGSPISGALANRAAVPLDDRLIAFAREAGLRYTRYSDDLFFSSSDSHSDSAVAHLVNSVDDAVRDSGFELNKQKTRVRRPGRPMRVLGLLVDGEVLRLDADLRHRIDRHLWAMERFGVHEHATHSGFDDRYGLLAHVGGVLDWAVHVSPGWARSRADRFARLARVNGFEKRDRLRRLDAFG